MRSSLTLRSPAVLALAALGCALPFSTRLASAEDVTATVAGRVSLGARTAGAGVPVTIVGGDGRLVPVRTDASGRFGAIGVAPGNVLVLLGQRGYNCRIRAGETGRFSVVAPPQEKLAPTAEGPVFASYRARHDTPCTIDASTQDLYVVGGQ